MPEFTKEVRERLERKFGHDSSSLMFLDVFAALSHIDALEARVAVLATARAEGHRAGMERAEKVIARLCNCYSDDATDCMACQCAAAIRAAAGALS